MLTASSTADLQRNHKPTAFKKVKRCPNWALGTLLTIHAGLLAYGAYVHSPVICEPAGLVAGISHWEFGRFELYRVNPPLVRMVAASPVMVVGHEEDWDAFDPGWSRSEFAVGRAFNRANGARTFWLFTLARWACIPFSLLGAYVCFRWASELYGEMAGILAATLWCFCPNIIAHGQLITADAGAAALGVTACYSFWRWLQSPNWTQTLISGGALGVAELTKSTLVIFYPLWPVIWFVYRVPAWKSMTASKWLHEGAMLLARTAIAVYIVNMGYGFNGSLRPLGEYAFVSDLLGGSSNSPNGSALQTHNRFANSVMACVPVPFPRDYVMGIDIQRSDFEHYHTLSYLNGEFSPTGWWYYYLYGSVIKVPLGTWLFALIVLILRVFQRLPVIAWRDEFALILPGIVMFAFVSSQDGFSTHFRYVLPAFPFAFIWMSQGATAFQSGGRLVRGILGVALTWSVLSSVWIYPHSLSYFNEVIGGPTNGHNHMLVSSLDWGQDLLYLKEWADEHPEAKPLFVAANSHVAPELSGLEYSFPPVSVEHQPDFTERMPDLAPGYYAVSANIFRGAGSRAYIGTNKSETIPRQGMSYFQKLDPIQRAGYSIHIYHVAPSTPNSREVARLNTETQTIHESGN